MNWLDWMIVIIIVLSALGGLRSSFLKSVAGLAGMVIGLVVACLPPPSRCLPYQQVERAGQTTAHAGKIFKT